MDNQIDSNQEMKIVEENDSLIIHDISPSEITHENVRLLKNRVQKAQDFFLEQRNIIKEKDAMIFDLESQLMMKSGFLGNPQQIELEVKKTADILQVKYPKLHFTKDDLCTIHSISKDNNLSLTSKDIWIYESKGKNVIVVSIYAYRKIASSFKGHHYGIKYLFGVKGSDGKMGWVDLPEHISDVKFCKAIMTHIDPMGRTLDTEVVLEVENYVKMYNGKAVGTWASYPLTMIQKVAEAQILRTKFPSLGGTLTHEEIVNIEDMDTKKVNKEAFSDAMQNLDNRTS